MHNQVNGAAATAAESPVHKLQAGDGKRTLDGMPFLPVVAIRTGIAHPQYSWQGNLTQRLELVAPELVSHASPLSCSVGRMLRHLLMLNR
jgi:hypothetical protein